MRVRPLTLMIKPLFHPLTSAGRFENKCPTNFSLSPSFDKLKLVGHQTDTLPADADGTDPIDLLEVAQ